MGVGALDPFDQAFETQSAFAVAVATAQATVIRAAGIEAHHDPDLVAEITAAVLAHLLPPRRPRISARKVKSPISRYAGHPLEERHPASTRITRIDIDLERPGTPPGPLYRRRPARRS
ncbi:hypothetical protein KDK95_08775 [Actinospica sp. MGRD01-02]|uniref:Uncharacterized protein n=1 Tax=Actinospica acidithermotolerans TaxID=2828514 RepID=A0A941IIR0_9ACTN|nr:hypothetical protein [Actinospica acidithermotolerans]MBR7826393.1 hypothetical protein [Actinospica acidithermotolerans]